MHKEGLENHRSFLAEVSWDPQIMNHIYMKGGSGNPIGKDGQRMLCSICNSPDHFRARCPQGKGGKGKSGGKFWTETTPVSLPDPTAFYNASTVNGTGMSSNGGTTRANSQMPASSSNMSSWYSQTETPVGRNTYITETQHEALPMPEIPVSTIHFLDGSAPILLHRRNPGSAPPRMSLVDSLPLTGSEVIEFSHSALADEITSYTFAVWDDHSPYFHSEVSIHGKQTLVLDTGAVGNLAGENTVTCMATEAKKHGHGTTYQNLDKKMPVSGIGENSSSCASIAKVPIMLHGGLKASYTAPLIEGSNVPALLGTQSMTQHNCIIDLVHNQLIMLGPGGIEIKLSPGSRVIPILRSSTGHLLISANEWNSNSANSASPALALPVL